MLTNTGKFMYLFYLSCILWSHSSPPCTSSPNFPEELQTKFLSTQWLRANTEHGSKMQKVMRQIRGTHHGDDLGVGKGFFLCVFFKGRRKNLLWTVEEKEAAVESF